MAEQWKEGKWGGAIVSETPLGDRDWDASEHVESYGGYLVCESVHPKHKALIIAAPQLLEALEAVKIRIAYIGMPQEARNDDGEPDWRNAIATIEKALAAARGEN